MAIKRRDRDREGRSDKLQAPLVALALGVKGKGGETHFLIPPPKQRHTQPQLGSGPQPRQNSVLGEASSSKCTEQALS